MCWGASWLFREALAKALRKFSVLTFTRRCCLTFSVLFFASFPSDGRARTKISIGLIDFYPYAMFTSSGPKGLLVEYVQNLLSGEPWDLEWKSVSISRAVEDLKSDNLDLVLTLFKTPARENVLRFSQSPLMNSAGGLCMLKTLSRLPLFKALRIVHIQGTLVPPALSQHSFVPITSNQAQERMILMLKSARADAVFSPRPEIIVLSAAEAGFDDKLKCFVFSDEKVPIYLASSRKFSSQIWRSIDQKLDSRIESFDDFLQRKLKAASPLALPIEEVRSSAFRLK